MSRLEGISVSLPLDYSPIDGPYRLNKDLGEVVRQNLKNLLLTSPGERIMLPDFGAGLRRVLFEPILPRTFEKARTRVMEQVSLYMPFLVIEDLQMLTSDQDDNIGPNQIRIIVSYNLGSLRQSDTLDMLIP